MDIILETKDLTKTYKAGGNHINAVDHNRIQESENRRERYFLLTMK